MIADLVGLNQALVSDLVARATTAYQARDWATALTIYRHLRDTYPAVAKGLMVPVIIARCEIELSDDHIPAWLDLELGAPSQHFAGVIHDIKLRAIECCRAGEFRRASGLLRLIELKDGPVSRTYTNGMLDRRSRCEAQAGAQGDAPPFIAGQGIGAWPVATLRERCEGRRVLFVRRYSYVNNPARMHEFSDRVTRSAASRGFSVLELNVAALPGPALETYVAVLQQTIATFKPDIIFYDELFTSGVSADPRFADDIATVLENARRRLGTRVVKGETDAWYIATFMPEQLFKHLGRCVDLVQHCHPAILDRGTDAEKAAVLCYPLPHFLPTPTVEAGTIARAVFVGSVTLINLARLVWWAETARAGLPVDFVEARVDAAEQISDLDYVNLLRAYQVSVNFTMRPTGVRILTGRAIEVPLAGGVLLEEDSLDTRYFMTPGAHYVPYETLPDLAAILPDLLRDDARRRELAAAGQAWATKYLTGDYFWAGLLHRLYG